MIRTRLAWSNVRHYLDILTDVYDADGTAWRRTNGTHHETLYRWVGERPEERGQLSWYLHDDTPVWLDPPPIPEWPDGTRIEFEHQTDVYAAWRDDESSVRAGWTAGDGGDVWCLFGNSVPRSWAVMWLEFGESLRTAVRLVPHPEDADNYGRWPTATAGR